MAVIFRPVTMLEDGMKRSIAAVTIALAALPLAACVEDGWGYGYGYGPYVGGVYSYDGYYDDYYGP
ncbi:MAG: hypothetical protein ACM3YM_07190, partial [Sphingomonadales bacterium]